MRTAMSLAVVGLLALTPLMPASADEPAPTGGDGDLYCSTYDTTEAACSFVADFEIFRFASDYVGTITLYDETEQRVVSTRTSPRRGFSTFNFLGGRTEVGHVYTMTLTGEGWFSIIEAPA